MSKLCSLPSLCLIVAAIAAFSLPFPVEAGVIHQGANNLGLVGYWSFENGTGTVATDFSGHRNHGTLTNMGDGTGKWVNGRAGRALQLDGVDDKVGVPDSSSFDMASFTLTAWIKTSDAGSGRRRVVSQQSSDNSTYWFMSLESNVLGLGSSMDFIRAKGGALNNNAWHHIAVVRSAAQFAYWYVDGDLLDSDAITNGDMYAIDGKDVCIGCFQTNSTSEVFRGLIDEVRIYKRALTAGEVKKLYEMGAVKLAPPPNRGLVGYWSFENGTGTVATDFSNKGNHGTLVGGPAWVNGRVGKALEFVSSNAMVRIPDSMSLRTPDSFTVSCWIKLYAQPASSRWVTCIAKGAQSESAGLNHTYSLGLDNGTFGTGLAVLVLYENSSGTNFTVRVQTTLSLNEWHHLVGVLDNQNDILRLYINGVLRGENLSATGNPDTGIPLVELGSAENDHSFGRVLNGVADEIRVYNLALTAAEVRGLYESSQRYVALNASTAGRGGTLLDGLVGHWTFDGMHMGTTSARDTSGNGNTGWLINGPAKTIGKLGQALTFDGVNDYVDLNVPDSLNLANANRFTLAAWVLPTSDPDGTGVISEDYDIFGPPGNVQYEIGFDIDSPNPGGLLKVGFFDGGEWHLTADTQRIPINTWTHISGTWDGIHLTLYKNGVLVSQSNAIASSLVSTGLNKYTIGRRHDNAGVKAFFPGLIDDVRIYNRALTPDEIKRLYNMGR